MRTLLEKLNYRGQKRIVVMNAGSDFVLSPGNELSDVQVDNEIDQRYPYGFMLIFVRKVTDVRKIAPVALHNLVDDGILWFCFQKKSSKKGSSELSRDYGWKPLNDMDFYGVRLVSVNQEWSALRFRNIKYIKATSSMFPKKN